MKQELLDFWDYVTHLGITADTDRRLRKYILLTNQISIIFVFLAIAVILLFVLALEAYVTAFLFGLGMIYFLVVLLLNLAGFVNFSRISVCIVAPFLVLLTLAYSKTLIYEQREIVHYFLPRIALLGLLVLPVTILDVQNRWHLFLGIGANFACLILFDPLHTYLGIGVEVAVLHFSGYTSIVNIVTIGACFMLSYGFWLLQRANLRSEEEVSMLLEQSEVANQALAKKQEELSHSYEKLKRSQQRTEASLKSEKESRKQLDIALKELKSAQVKLIQSEKMASLGQLTAGIAHEINNPINFVYAGSGALSERVREVFQLLEKYENIAYVLEAEDIAEIQAYKEEIDFEHLEQDIKDLNEDICKGALRIIELIKGLRHFSRLDESHQKFVNIHEGLDATLVLLTPETKHRIYIKRKYDHHIPKIECNPGELNQVFVNILNNSIKAIKDKGEILIQTRNMSNEIEILIKDNGKGMTADVLEKVFEPFFSQQETEKDKGSGLGLSIAYGIIQKHNGTIEVSSSPDIGSEFRITLPKIYERKKQVFLTL
ncbi:MAG: ATP-binding protein [Bernardetiaceae bacterium]|nr:ATP-binding protein [Bernardetiaceae bacterium]